MADPLAAAAATESVEPGRVWLNELFNAFLRDTIPTPQAYANARYQAEDIVHAIRCALYPIRIAAGVKGDSLIVGSVGKRSALAPIRAVDVLYLLPSRLRINSSGEACKIIKASLNNQFEKSVLLDDELGTIVSTESLQVRIIPALEINAGYKIPGPSTRQSLAGWRIANPVSEAATLRLSDGLYMGATRRLLTILKSWKETIGVQISSFALEVLVQDYFGTQKRQIDLPEDFRAFVAWGRSRTHGAISAPCSQSEIQIDETWHSCAKAAYWRATLAEQCLLQDPKKAALEWRHLLGKAFPVPEDVGPVLPSILEACA